MSLAVIAPLEPDYSVVTKFAAYGNETIPYIPILEKFIAAVNAVNNNPIYRISYQCTRNMNRVGFWHQDDKKTLSKNHDLFLYGSPTGVWIADDETGTNARQMPGGHVLCIDQTQWHKSPDPINDLRLFMRILKRKT